MSYEEFLEWCDEDTRAEWVEGEVIVLMRPSLPHQLLVGFLYFVLQTFCRLRSAGVVLVAPFQMKLSCSGREPDLIVVKQEHADRLLRSRLDGPADLVVEVVSPDSWRRDRVDKFEEYAAAGVAEYWLLDPDRRRADFYGLGQDRRYQPLPVDAAGIVHSAVLPGLWLRVDWLWQAPLPDLEAVRELGLLDAPNANRQ
jgi:Uma2 family endonuclease